MAVAVTHTSNQPFVSLKDADKLGHGEVHDLGKVLKNHAMIVYFEGYPINVDVRLELSHDGKHWVNQGSYGGNPVGAGQDAFLVKAGDVPARYVRASVYAMDGGREPTVTASIASS